MARCMESEVMSLPNRYRSIKVLWDGEYEWWVASCGRVRIVAFSFVGLDVSDSG